MEDTLWSWSSVSQEHCHLTKRAHGSYLPPSERQSTEDDHHPHLTGGDSGSYRGRVESEAFMSHVPSEEKVSDGGGNRLKWQRCDGGMGMAATGEKAALISHEREG